MIRKTYTITSGGRTLDVEKANNGTRADVVIKVKDGLGRHEVRIRNDEIHMLRNFLKELEGSE